MGRSFVLALCAVVGALVPAPIPAASAAVCAPVASGPTRAAGIGGIARPRPVTARCASSTGSPYRGTPPLLNHGGPVMSVPSVNNRVIVTAIYWAPSGFAFSPGYQRVINAYLADLAADSGRTTNVFASIGQYAGSNGAYRYGIRVNPPILDTTPYPASGCTVNGGAIYNDGTGYRVCLDNAQLAAETSAVIAARGLGAGFGRLYLMLTPQGVETCFQPGNPSGQSCTVNYTASSGFCAYHSFMYPRTDPQIWADLPYPVFDSPTGATCGSDAAFGQTQAPNGTKDADVEISMLSHEAAEAFSDPEMDAWYDSSGGENGDDCAFTYGTVSGAAGAYYNQVINGHHYLTQEEFSNAAYVAGVSGCVQQGVPGPVIDSMSPAAGPVAGGQTVVITGSHFTGASAVNFKGTRATSFTVDSDTQITAVTPARDPGPAAVRVTTPNGRSPTTSGGQYTFDPLPTVTAVSPASGTSTGGTPVTITGTGFVPGATVVIGGTAATSVVVVNATTITARTPAHGAGSFHARVSTPGGLSAGNSADLFTFG